MDRRRWILVAVALAMTAIALLLLRRGSSSSSGETPAGAGAASSAVGGATGDGRAPRPDPRELPAASLAGTVRDEAGAPIAGASVCATSQSPDVASEDARIPRCADTGADGAWRITDLWPARWWVEASAERRIPAAWRDDALHDGAIRLRAGEDRTGIDLVLRGGGVACEGTVLDLTGGTVGGAAVQVSGYTGAACRTHSADDGTFRCWIAPGGLWASAVADGYTDGWATGVVPGSRVEILLTPESVLGGVVTQAGAPVAGARVKASGVWGQGPVTFTGADGRFRFAHLAPDRYSLSAEIEGGYGEAGESVLVGLAQTRDDLVIELSPAAPVTATVMIDGPTPAPADGCNVALSRGDGRRYDTAVQQGAVTFAAVQPGTYIVQVTCDLYLSRAPYPDLVVAAAPVEAAWLVDTGPTVRGIVVDTAGKPIADASIYARNVGGDPRAASASSRDETFTDGSFVIVGLRAGKIELNATAPDHPRLDPPLELELTADVDDVRITLADAGAIQGTVVDETGVPVARLEIRARGNPDGGSGETGDDGAFLVRGVPAGTYRVFAYRDNDLLRKPGNTDDDIQGERVVVKNGETTTVQLVVESAGGVIRGRVVDAAGQPVNDAFVRAEREPEGTGRQRGNALRGARWSWSQRPAVTDVDGAFAIEHLAPGKYSVLAYRTGGSEAHAEGVALGETVTLTITPTGSIAGTIATGGAPPDEVKIDLIDPDTGVGRSERFFRTGGAWSLHDLPAGSYDLTATAVGGTASLENVALTDGQQLTGVTIELRATVSVTGRVVDETTRAPVPGMRVMVSAIDGASGMSWRPGDAGDQISDASGKFTVKDAPQGRVRISIRPKDFGASEYLRGGGIATLTAPGPVELGDLVVLKRRTPRNGKAGDLGFTLTEMPPDVDPAEVTITVATVRKDGAAARSGLVPGDVIVSVDGHDVRGEASWEYRARAQVPEGTKVQLELARGETLAITAGPPP